MSAAAERGGDAERVEELLRVNAELAAEVRSLTLGRADSPRSGAMPSSRQLGRLIDERNEVGAALEGTRAELAQCRHLLDGLQVENRELIAELEQMRLGFRGLLRRLRARLLRRSRANPS